MARRRPLVPASEKLAAGRPLKMPPPDAVAIVEQAAQAGASMKGFAVALGCSVDTLRRWMDDDPALQQAIDIGRERERKILHDVVFQMAVAGKGKDSLLAAFMLLQNRHGYKDAQAEQGNRVNVTFNIPAAQPMADFIEVTNADGTEVQRISAKAAVAARRS